MSSLPRILATAGIFLLLLSLALYAWPNLPLLGRLPGDIRVEREGFRLYFPLSSCLLLSVLLSLAMALYSRLR